MLMFYVDYRDERVYDVINHYSFKDVMRELIINPKTAALDWKLTPHVRFSIAERRPYIKSAGIFG